MGPFFVVDVFKVGDGRESVGRSPWVARST